MWLNNIGVFMNYSQANKIVHIIEDERVLSMLADYCRAQCLVCIALISTDWGKPLDHVLINKAHDWSEAHHTFMERIDELRIDASL
jgi:hypothetical protein